MEAGLTAILELEVGSTQVALLEEYIQTSEWFLNIRSYWDKMGKNDQKLSCEWRTREDRMDVSNFKIKSQSASQKQERTYNLKQTKSTKSRFKKMGFSLLFKRNNWVHRSQTWRERVWEPLIRMLCHLMFLTLYAGQQASPGHKTSGHKSTFLLILFIHCFKPFLTKTSRVLSTGFRS